MQGLGAYKHGLQAWELKSKDAWCITRSEELHQDKKESGGNPSSA